jgi:hypothetical protein
MGKRSILNFLLILAFSLDCHRGMDPIQKNGKPRLYTSQGICHNHFLPEQRGPVKTSNQLCLAAPLQVTL